MPALGRGGTAGGDGGRLAPGAGARRARPAGARPRRRCDRRAARLPGLVRRGRAAGGDRGALPPGAGPGCAVLGPPHARAVRGVRQRVRPLRGLPRPQRAAGRLRRRRRGAGRAGRGRGGPAPTPHMAAPLHDGRDAVAGARRRISRARRPGSGTPGCPGASSPASPSSRRSCRTSSPRSSRSSSPSCSRSASTRSTSRTGGRRRGSRGIGPRSPRRPRRWWRSWRSCRSSSPSTCPSGSCRSACPPTCARARRRSRPNTVLLTVPFAVSGSPQPMLWQAVDGYHFRLAGAALKTPNALGGPGRAGCAGIGPADPDRPDPARGPRAHRDAGADRDGPPRPAGVAGRRRRDRRAQPRPRVRLGVLHHGARHGAGLRARGLGVAAATGGTDGHPGDGRLPVAVPGGGGGTDRPPRPTLPCPGACCSAPGGREPAPP